MTSSRTQVAAAIVALNGEGVPFAFAESSSGVVGVWDYADATWAGILSAGTIDRSYELIVELHDDGTYTLTDRTSQTTSGIGRGGLSFSHSTFRGKVHSVSFDSSVAPIASDRGQIGHTYGWSFSTDEMKRPVRTVLAQHGWTERKIGFWARLFG